MANGVSPMPRDTLHEPPGLIARLPQSDAILSVAGILFSKYWPARLRLMDAEHFAMAVTVGNNEARPTERADPEPKQSISHRSAQKTRPLVSG